MGISADLRRFLLGERAGRSAISSPLRNEAIKTTGAKRAPRTMRSARFRPADGYYVLTLGATSNSVAAVSNNKKSVPYPATTAAMRDGGTIWLREGQGQPCWEESFVW